MEREPRHQPRLAREFARRAGILDLWQIDLARPISDADRALLDEAETARADRIIIESKRRQSYRARAELRRVLGLYLDAAPEALRFCYGEHGKPALATPYVEGGAGGRAPLCFNLTHSGTVGLIGVIFERPELALGVDVEEARPGREFASIARSFFSPAEVAVFDQLAPAEHREAFYRAWTRKEAYLKAIATGLSFSSTAFTITFGRGEATRLLHTERPGDDPRRWRMVDLACDPGYSAAACWDGEALELRYFHAPCSAPERES